jgi:hypothetical protein
MAKEPSARKPPKVDKAARPELTRRLRDVLAERPLEFDEMRASLQAEEALVLDALRRLGKKKRGRLRSGVVDGRNCWWWEPPGAVPETQHEAGDAP